MTEVGLNYTMIKLVYPLVWLLKSSKALSSIAVRLSKLTGKSKYRIHPKHLIAYEKPWYLKDIKSNDEVLDLGCNNGQHSLRVAKRCKRITGLDQNKDQLKIAKASSKDKGIKNVTWQNHNLEKKLSLKANSFNKVLCLDVAEVNKILDGVGFKIISLKPIVYDTPWIGFFDLLGGISLKLYAKISVWKKEKVKSNLKESTGFRIVIQKIWH